MQRTENYGLNQWDTFDPVRRADFNADNAAIDAALAANAKAQSDYQTANDAAVAKKAEQSALNNTNSQLAALAANLGSAGKNARIAWGSYTGDGTYGEDNPTSLTFDFYPVVIVVTSTQYTSSGTVPTVMVRSSGKVFPETNTEGGLYLALTWNDDSVSWYTNYSYSSSREPCGQDQLNYDGTVYYYAALGYDKSVEAV